MVTHAVRKCEAEGMPCTVTRIAKELRIPESNVRRTLGELVKRNIVRRVGRQYLAVSWVAAEGGEARLDSFVNAILNAAKELVAELDGSRDEKKRSA